MNNSGIYQIVNMLTGDSYIGSSFTIEKRIGNHFSSLRHNYHDNIHLQRAFNKYGETAFSHHILLLCERSNLLKYEQIFIDDLRPQYNKAKFALSPMKGLKQTPEARQAMSDKLRGRLLSEDHKARISAAHMGKKQEPHSEAHKRKISEAGKGRKLSAEGKAKISRANTGRVQSEEQKRQNGISHSKAVVRINPVTSETKLYNSITLAAADGFTLSNVARCCKGERKVHKGYNWKFVESGHVQLDKNIMPIVEAAYCKK